MVDNFEHPPTVPCSINNQSKSGFLIRLPLKLVSRWHHFSYQNYTTIVRKRSKIAAQQFRDLQGIDPVIKDQISPTVRKAIIIANKFHASNQLYSAIISRVVGFIFIITSIIIIINIMSTLSHKFSALDLIVAFILFLVLFFFVLAKIQANVLKYLKVRTFYIWNILFLILSIVVVYYLLFIANPENLNVLTIAILWLCITLVFYVIILIPLINLTYLPWWLILKIMGARYFEDLIIVNLLQLAYLMRIPTQLWSKIEFRRQRADELEIAAKYFENELHRALSTDDFATNSWLEETGQKIAATFRLYRRSILLPTKTTQNDLQAQLLTSFLCATQGDWGSIVQSEPISLDKTQVFLLLKRLVRALVTGAVPLIVFRVILSLGFSLGGTASDILTLVMVLWLILAILEVVDPNYSNRLDSLKTIRDLFHL